MTVAKQAFDTVCRQNVFSLSFPVSFFFILSILLVLFIQHVYFNMVSFSFSKFKMHGFEWLIWKRAINKNFWAFSETIAELLPRIRMFHCREVGNRTVISVNVSLKRRIELFLRIFFHSFLLRTSLFYCCSSPSQVMMKLAVGNVSLCILVLV